MTWEPGLSHPDSFIPVRAYSGIRTCLCLVLLVSLCSSRAGAQEDEGAGRLYVTNAERREAGLEHELTPWLTASFLLELEGEIENYRLIASGAKENQRSANATLQAGFVVSPWEQAKAELVLEYDTETEQLIADEAFASLELNDSWEIEAGRMYTPFGVYISHFATGPLLELGETRADMVLLSYSPSEQLDLSIAAYRGDARKTGQDSDRWDGALGIEGWLSEQLAAGLSYQSDLADADERLLEDWDDRYQQRVPAISGFVVWSVADYEITLEALGALKDFRELDRDRNRPLAWNLEFVHFFGDRFEWALRVEGSRELEDAPELQGGASLTWRAWENSTLTVEYLRGRFETGLAVSDDDEPYDRVESLAAQFSLLF